MLKITLNATLNTITDMVNMDGNNDNFEAVKGLKRISSFTEKLRYKPEISGITVIAEDNEIPLIFNNSSYETNVIDEKNLLITAELNDVNDEFSIEYMQMGYTCENILEAVKNTRELLPMYISLDIEGYDMYNNDYIFTLKDIEVDGCKIKDRVIKKFNIENEL